MDKPFNFLLISIFGVLADSVCTLLVRLQESPLAKSASGRGELCFLRLVGLAFPGVNRIDVIVQLRERHSHRAF